MYTALLFVHSWLRWLVIFSGIAVLGGAVNGVTARRPWLSGDNLRTRIFTASLDLQVLLGLILYIISPVTRSGFGDMALTMRDPILRFFVVEHMVGMIIAAALAHVGLVRARKQTDAARQHRAVLVFVSLALIVMLLSIPWPGMPGGRVLFRGF